MKTGASVWKDFVYVHFTSFTDNINPVISDLNAPLHTHTHRNMANCTDKTFSAIKRFHSIHKPASEVTSVV
jgi:hypothetical protein